MFLLPLLLCLYLCFPSMIDLGARTAGENIEDNGLDSNIERHPERWSPLRERVCRVFGGSGSYGCMGSIVRGYVGVSIRDPDLRGEDA